MSTAHHARCHHYIMRDQVTAKVRAIMEEDPRRKGAARDLPEPLLSRPGWVAVTLLVVAFNLMAILPPAA